MSQTSRERVRRTLTFGNPDRTPRDIWLLPWAEINYPETVQALGERFPSDFARLDYLYSPSPRVKGDQYAIGYYTDEWRCVFESLQAGSIGQVKTPVLPDIADWQSIEPPYEQLPKGRLEKQAAYDVINRSCGEKEQFIIPNANSCCPRPWERYQFIRGTVNSLMDIMMPDEKVRGLLRRIHEYYLMELEFWVKSDVDAIMFMDDWGSQNQLLINPHIWHDLFKPLYKDYCDLAHTRGKFAMMHSDGYIIDIYEPLIEVGVDALNSQLFCMDFSDLAKRAKGRITFWGEIDRQHVLPSNDPQMARNAVRKVAEYLFDSAGGVIAQCEFGLSAQPDSVIAVFDEWERIDSEYRHSI